ncbi:glycogen synthase GlgA [Methylotenera versatilis]|uniref:glycogen synthase GlgA n=1 Tax=Methylotenera versatilis TaxID=1055487 RepID=UPI00064867B6|nr:glycogen synthase GlgA [Methylotenera versatilis]
MRVLFATSEAYPLIKTGGLADVSGALPKAIQQLPTFDGEIKLLIPGYSAVLAKLKNIKVITDIQVLNQACSIITGKMPDSDLDVIVIKNAYLYERVDGPYSDENGKDWPDNPLRFGVLSRVASLLCSAKSPMPDWIPDLIQCNDWQTGLTPAYMKLIDNSQTKSILSIHNLAFQGNFDASWISLLELPIEHFKMDGYEYFNQVSFLKAGLFYADQLSTVSPTYAKEIQTETFGFGLQGLLATRSNALTGILNGIDTQEWNPATDAHLSKNFSNKRITGKQTVKQALQQQLGLQNDANAPLLGIVSRLTHQKGLDLLPSIMPQLIQQGCQFAILGSGDKMLEASFNDLAEQFPNQVSMNTGYHEHLSHNIMAGADLFIMPSRFEPCGLNQLYGLSYGTPPIVTATGGLADSVTDTTDATIKDHTATGFIIQSTTSTSLLLTIQRAVEIWKNKKTRREIQKNGMNREVSWAFSAQLYLDLYEKTLLTN